MMVTPQLLRESQMSGLRETRRESDSGAREISKWEGMEGTGGKGQSSH